MQGIAGDSVVTAAEAHWQEGSSKGKEVDDKVADYMWISLIEEEQTERAEQQLKNILSRGSSSFQRTGGSNHPTASGSTASWVQTSSITRASPQCS